MNHLMIGAMLGVLAFPAACVPFTTGPLRAEDSAAALASRSLGDPGLRRFMTEQKAGGGSWTVNRLGLAAAYFNGSVRVARAEAEQAAAGVTTAGEIPNPVLSFAPGYNSSNKGISPWIFAPTLDVPIETAGKRDKRVAQARAEAEAARLRVSAAAWEARSLVRAAMVDLHAADRLQVLLDTEVGLHREALARLEAQVREGDLPAFELTQERLSLSRAQLALHDAGKQQATARTRLAAAVGVPAAALDGAKLDFSDLDALPGVPGAAARRRALTHRADLLALLADYSASDAALRLEIAKQFPDVHLGPGYEFDQGDHKWSLGVGIDLPVFSRNLGAISQAEAARRTAGVRFEAKQAEVLGEIESALAAYRAARAKVATATSLAAEATHAATISATMVNAGELTPLDLTRRKIEASAAELIRSEAEAEAQQAAGALEAALQVPLKRAK